MPIITPAIPSDSAATYLQAVDVANRAAAFVDQQQYQATVLELERERVALPALQTELAKSQLSFANVMADAATKTRDLTAAMDARLAAALQTMREGLGAPATTATPDMIAHVAAQLAAAGRPAAQAVIDAAEIVRRAALLAPKPTATGA